MRPMRLAWALLAAALALAACLPPLEPLPTPLVVPTALPATETLTPEPTDHPTETAAPTATDTLEPTAAPTATAAPRAAYDIFYTEDGLPRLVTSTGANSRALDLGFDDETTLNSISPDGQWLAYFTGGEIYTYNFETAAPPQPFVTTAYVKAMRWKPDSNTLYFAVYPRGGREMGGGIWSFAFTGVDPVNHVNSTEARGDWRRFSFSPDGLLAALCPAPEETGFTCGGLYILDIVLRLAQKVDLPRGCDPVFLSWAPDGTRLAVGCNGLLGGGAKIYVVDPRALTSYMLSPRGYSDSWPVWSPDGTQIAFRSCVNQCEIWISDAVDGEQRRAVGTAIIGTGRLFWTPDGNLLAAVRDERNLEAGIYRISPATGGAVLVTPAKLSLLLGVREYTVTGGQ
jgi:Tol biopolymer transport system component